MPGPSFSYPAATTVMASGASATGPVDGRSGSAFGIMVPAAFTGTVINFAVSADGLTWVPLYDASNALVAQTIAPGRGYSITTAVAGWPFWEITSPSAQGGDRSIVIVSKS
jgi:hypothetical protein